LTVSPTDSQTDYCRRYFTESWKTITGLCHTFRRHFRRIWKLSDGNTDEIFPSVSHRELEKNYGLVPPFPTASLTDSPTGITDGTHRRKSHIPKRMPVRSTITDNIVGGTFSDGNFRRNYRRIKKRRYFQNFWCAFQFIFVGITDRN
jgi:hypothetical protein